MDTILGEEGLRLTPCCCWPFMWLWWWSFEGREEEVGGRRREEREALLKEDFREERLRSFLTPEDRRGEELVWRWEVDVGERGPCGCCGAGVEVSGVVGRKVRGPPPSPVWGDWGGGGEGERGGVGAGMSVPAVRSRSMGGSVRGV